MNGSLSLVVEKINFDTIAPDRIEKLHVLVNYIQSQINKEEQINLIFICTHNSRRSQFAQVWAKIASEYYGITIGSFSGGVEVTEFNSRAIESLRRFGFIIDFEKQLNSKYSITFDSECEPIISYSKLYNHQTNPNNNFAAIMTCSHADENCPIIYGADERIPIRYDDPKNFDNTPLESSMYDYRSFQIATEIFYVFSKIID